jgi:hypothetical protein
VLLPEILVLPSPVADAMLPLAIISVAVAAAARILAPRQVVL